MTPIFLQKLGLDKSADERAVRRAYAVRLKQIDQEADAAGFQALRASYEAALKWAKQKKESASDVERITSFSESSKPEKSEKSEDSAAFHAPLQDEVQASRNRVEKSEARADADVQPDIAVIASEQEQTRQQEEADFTALEETVPRLHRRPHDAAHVASPAAERDDAQVNADAEYARFMEAFQQAVSAAGDAVLDAEVWGSNLKKSLESDRLVNMTAREIFESRFANLLAHGWMPGHEVLFVVAAKVFGWDGDRRRLLGLGEVGNTLERALHERAIFDTQSPQTRKLQRALIQRLRSRTDPGQQELTSNIALLNKIANQFPTWLHVITDMNQARRWNALHGNLAPEARRMEAVAQQVKASPSQSGAGGYWGYGFVAMLLANALMHACSNSH